MADDSDSGATGRIEKRISSLWEEFANTILRLWNSNSLRFLRERRTAFGVAWKAIVFFIGILLLFLSSWSSVVMASTYGFSFYGSAGSAILAISSASLILASLVIVSSLPASVRIPFVKKRFAPRDKPVFGFVSLLAVGVGSTLGSPLFVLIPENVHQYAMASIISLVLATVLSLGLGFVYINSYSYSNKNNLEVVGGPDFVRNSTGTRSLRYFITRFSLWVANSALSAYSAILFGLFDFDFLPGILLQAGDPSAEISAIQYLIILLLIIWFLVSAFANEKLLRAVGYAQVVLVAIMYFVLVGASVMLGTNGSLSNIAVTQSGIGLIPAIIINTGYLYIIFFGFQEIMAVNKASKDDSKVPLGRVIGFSGRVPKERYLPLAIILTILLSSFVNILFAVVFLALPLGSTNVKQLVIPAIYLVNRFGGYGWEIAMAVVFLIASVTTFAPAFLAASRHMGAMGRDGFLPGIFSSFSWLFTLLFLVVLLLVGPNLLIGITDFMVLVGLSLISFSSVWIRHLKLREFGRYQYLAIVVGLGCLVSSIAIYFREPVVVLFGIIAILFTYLIYDIFELGSMAMRIFLAFFMLMEAAIIPMFVYPTYYVGNAWYQRMAVSIFANGTWIEVMLFVAALLLILDLVFDIVFAKNAKIKVKI